MVKNPLLINLCTGTIGSFVSMIDVVSEKNMVKICYIPLNSLKKVITTETYPRHAISNVIPDNIAIPGVAQMNVVIWENSAGVAPFLDKVKADALEKAGKFKEEVQLKELEVSQQKFRARESKEESKKQIAQDMELVKNQRRPEDSLFGGGLGQNRFRDYMNPGNDEYNDEGY
jgi:hypothetical protein